jgi:iron(III) transport system ATP-binding protein
MARLSGYEKRTPDQLSGGQQQRVGLARAMVIEPQVLLMDEPLSNLDAKLRVEMRSEIRDIQQQLGITTIYVTHDQEEALVISDRIAVMNLGVVHQVGTAWEVYKRPTDEFVASFVGRMNFIPAEVTRHDGKRVLAIPGCAAVIRGNSAVECLDEAIREVSLAVRPEDLSIGPAEAGSNASLSCVVEKSTFTGSLIQYGLSFGDARRLIVECHRPERDSIIPAGRRVSVEIPPAAIHLFDRAGGGRLGGGDAE